MMPHSRFWWFVLLVVIFFVLATALGRSESGPAPKSPPSVPAPAAAPAVSPATETAGAAAGAETEATEEHPRAALAVKLLLHVAATAVALRIAMSIFYESVLWPGFLAIVSIDALVTAAMIVLAPLSDGFTALLGPQVVVTALVMVITLHHYGFTKARFTVIPTVLVAKIFGFFGEVALRLVFLDAMLRWAVERGL